MEIIQAFLFTSKYILGKNGNYDLYYLFGAFVIVWYFLCKQKALVRIIKYYLPFLVIGIIMLLFYPQINLLKLIVYEMKLLLCIVLMVFVIEEYAELNWDKVAVISCMILGVETIVALITQAPYLWRVNDVINKFASNRLELCYIEPSELSFHCGILAIYFIYLLFVSRTNVTRKNMLCLLIVLVDMLLSAGMGGILGTAIAAVVLILYLTWQKLKNNRLRGVILPKKIILTYILGGLALVLLILSGSSFVLRMQAVISGEDSSFISRFVGPINALGGIMESTNWLGCSFGNLNSEYGLKITGLSYTFPNSLPYFIAEAGIFAIILLIPFVLVLFRLCFKYKDVLSLCFCVYIFVYQIAGGYFTNPVNYWMYGLIIGRTMQIKKQRKLENGDL